MLSSRSEINMQNVEGYSYRIQYRIRTQVLAGMQLALVEQLGLTAAKGESQLLPKSHKLHTGTKYDKFIHKKQ